MSTDVIVPWAGGCPYRTAALRYVTELLRDRHPDWGVVVGHGNPDRWCKAEAVADALTRSTAERIVIHDGDVWSDGTEMAVLSLDVAPWAMPHGDVHRLTLDATRRVLGGLDPLVGARPAQPEPKARYERVHPGFAGGGIVALRRELYESVPLDPRYVGWGHEDETWAWALGMLAGKPWRGKARLFHLWHPPQVRDESRGPRGSTESWALRQRYLSAVRSKDPARMRQLVAEFQVGVLHWP